jgi:hypothetical protein
MRGSCVTIWLSQRFKLAEHVCSFVGSSHSMRIGGGRQRVSEQTTQARADRSKIATASCRGGLRLVRPWPVELCARNCAPSAAGFRFDGSELGPPTLLHAVHRHSRRQDEHRVRHAEDYRCLPIVALFTSNPAKSKFRISTFRPSAIQQERRSIMASFSRL